MSRTAVIVALLVAIGLGIAAIFLTDGKKNPPVTGPLLAFDPSHVDEMRVTFPDGTFQAVHRDAAGEWRVVLGGSGQPSRAWPAAETQVHSALRIFSSLTPDRSGEGSFQKPAGTLTVSGGSKDPQSLRISDQRLAGKVLIESDGPPKRSGWIDTQIADMLIKTGIQAWRNAAALPGLGPEASRVTIKAHTGTTLTLARIQGKWALREPVSEPADADAVNHLFQTLAAARITDFCDKGPPSVTGLDNPIAMLTVESDFRDPAGGAASTVKQSLTVGQAADIAGKTVVVRLDQAVQGTGIPADNYSEVVIASAEHLAAINTDPMAYISKQAVQTPAAEIGKVVIKRQNVEPAMTTFSRSLDGWEVAEGDAKSAAATVADTAMLSALLDLLSTTPCEKASLREGTAESPVASIDILSLGGTPVGSVGVAIQGTKLSLLNEKVRREYAAAAVKGVAEWLGRR
jgi:hypothetical protein